MTVEFRVLQEEKAAGQSDDEMPLFQFMREREAADEAPGAPPATSAKTGGGDPNGSAINPQMTFERYIVNDSNELATEAAQAVAEHPATVYNPFLVYGGVGIGKTHLLQAIAKLLRQPRLAGALCFVGGLHQRPGARHPQSDFRHVSRQISYCRCAAGR